MLDYKIKIGIVPMRRNTTDRPKGTFLTWYSAEQRGERFVRYIEENYTSDKVSFVDSKDLGHKNLIYDGNSADDMIDRLKENDVDAVSWRKTSNSQRLSVIYAMDLIYP